MVLGHAAAVLSSIVGPDSCIVRADIAGLYVVLTHIRLGCWAMYYTCMWPVLYVVLKYQGPLLPIAYGRAPYSITMADAHRRTYL